MVKYDTIEDEIWVLTEEGNEIVDKGSHEAKVFEAIPAGKDGIAISELQVFSNVFFTFYYVHKKVTFTI